MATSDTTTTPVGESAQELLRGLGGGLLFGTPLLFTMEMWWHGFLMPWWKIVLLLAVTAVFVYTYVLVGGFRREHTTAERLADTIVTFGLGAAVSALMLFVLGQIGAGDTAREVVGKIALETIPVAMGVAVARNQLAGRGGGGDGDDDEEGSREPTPLGQAVVAAGGAMLFAFNVAPTEEPMMLGIENEWWRIVLLLLLMIPITVALVFFADFRGGHGGRHGERRSVLLTPLGESVLSVAVALLVAGMLLWFFGRLDAGTGPAEAAHMIVTLGFVAVLGSSVARLLT